MASNLHLKFQIANEILIELNLKQSAKDIAAFASIVDFGYNCRFYIGIEAIIQNGMQTKRDISV